MITHRFPYAVSAGDKRSAPAALRNRDTLAEVFQQFLPARGAMLEIAAGTGEHAVFFADRFRAWEWLATDAEDASLASIAAYRQEVGLENLAEPMRLDVDSNPWFGGQELFFDAVFCANMIHIAPWESTEALFAGVAKHLRRGGLFFIYGPFSYGGIIEAESNRRFDADLKAFDPRFGLRDAHQLSRIANRHGYSQVRDIPMPANNRTMIFRKD